MKLKTILDTISKKDKLAGEIITSIISHPRKDWFNLIESRQKSTIRRMLGANDWDFHALGSQDRLLEGLNYLLKASNIAGDDELANIPITYPNIDYKCYGWAVYHRTKIEHGIAGKDEILLLNGLDDADLESDDSIEQAVKKCDSAGIDIGNREYVEYGGDFYYYNIAKKGFIFTRSGNDGWKEVRDFCKEQKDKGFKVLVTTACTSGCDNYTSGVSVLVNRKSEVIQ